MKPEHKWALIGLGVLGVMAVSTKKANKPREYQVTPEDKLWLLRAVEAEGAPEADVARTLISLFVHLYSMGGDWTLTKLVRAYAQPVNPRWFKEGDKLKERLLKLTPAEQTKELKRAEIRERQHSTRTTFSPEATRAVDAALSQGWTDHRTDYAAPFLDATKKGYVQVTPHIAGQNTFWTRSPRWNGYTVKPGEILVRNA